MLRFSITGYVRDAETRAPLAGWFVKALDIDLFFDDVLGSAITADDGSFVIHTELSDFRELIERRPDVYFRVAPSPDSGAVHSTEDAVSYDDPGLDDHEILVPGLTDLMSGTELSIVDDDGRPAEAFGPGGDVRIEADGLAPARAYDIRVAAAGEELFTARLITDRRGRLPATVLWPQAFLDDPATAGTFTLDEARDHWRDVEVSVDVLTGGKAVLQGGFRFDPESRRPVVFASDAEGRPRNGVDPDADAIHITFESVPPAEIGRVLLVPRQRDWRPGDRLAPVELADGEAAVFDVELPRDGSATTAELVAVDRLLPGAYDLVVRGLRYGYEVDEELRLHHDDVVSRFVTGLVVREDFMASKFALGGCVNKLPISGSKVSGSPYFQFRNTFTAGEDVWGALDPAAIGAGSLSKMCAFYVVPSRSSAQWAADNSLSHLAVLGGNSAVTKVKVGSSCINANDVLLWPNATQLGDYDIVADFGNNTSSAAAFVPDDAYDTPLDVIDGYIVAGFRIIADPGTMSDFAHIGNFNYTEATSVPGFGVPGLAVVVDEVGSYHTPGGFSTSNLTVPLRAHVYFPADAAGVIDPGQISSSAADYPLVVVVHGNGHSYTSYDALLQHLAANGFIAASINLSTGMSGLGRANVLFEHIPILHAMFGAKAQNNIGLLGHSRGGEGIVKAARLNQTDALGHGINALLALAPTDQYGSETVSGAWATPYLLLYGSRDGDINGGIWTPGYTVPQTGFAVLDRSSGAEKTSVFVYKATHNGFITTNYDADFGDMGDLLTPADQQKVTMAYANAFFRRHLQNEAQWKGMFTGEWRPASVEATGLDLYVQYRNAASRPVDDFESGAGWTVSSSGGTVSQTGLAATPAEGRLHDHPSAAGLDDRSPHDSRGIQLRWNSLGDEVEFSVPAAGKNVSGFAAISARISQVEASASNPANQAQNLRIALRDGSGNERAVRTGSFREIPFPDQRSDASVRKSAMASIRIPLHAYTIVAAGAQQVDLTDVVSVKLQFTEKPTGEIDVDDVEFTD